MNFKKQQELHAQLDTLATEGDTTYAKRTITVTVHQLQLTEAQCNLLNNVGRDRAYKISEKIFAHDEVKFDGFKPEYFRHYEQQGEIEVDPTVSAEIGIDGILERIFQAGNDDGYGSWADRYNRYKTAYSISVGDIIILGETAFIVAGQGFTQIELGREDAVA